MCELFDPVEFKQKLEQFYTYHQHIHALLPNKDENKEQIARLGRAMTMFLKAKRTINAKVKQLQLSAGETYGADSNTIMQKREEIRELIKHTHELDSSDVTQQQLKENLLAVLQYLYDIFQQNADQHAMFQQLFDHLEHSNSAQELYLSEQNDLLHNGFTYMNDSIDAIKTEQKTMHDEVRTGLQDSSKRLGQLEANHEAIELYHAEQNDIIHDGFSQIDERFTHLDETLSRSEETIAKGFVETHEQLHQADERMQEHVQHITDKSDYRADIEKAERIMYDQDNNTRICAVLTVWSLSTPGLPISCTVLIGGATLYYLHRSLYHRQVIEEARKSIQS